MGCHIMWVSNGDDFHIKVFIIILILIKWQVSVGERTLIFQGRAV